MADTMTRRHRASENLRRDIQETRSRMDETVDALAGRLSPDHLLDEAWGRLRGQGEEGIGQVVKEHPIPVALVGVGLGWLAVEQASERSDGRVEGDVPTGRTERPITYAEGPRYGEGAEWTGYDTPAGHVVGDEADGEAGSDRGMGERISDAASAVKEKVSSAAESARERASGAMDAARERAHDRGDRARERISHARASLEERARHRGRQARRGFWSMLEDNPLALGAVAFGIGLASGMSVPSSRIEDRVMGRASDTLEDEAKRVGERTAEQAKHVAREAAATAMEEAERVVEPNDSARMREERKRR